MSLLRCFSVLGLALASAAFAREIEGPQFEANRYYKDQLKSANALASALQKTVKNFSDFASQVNEARGINEIAASIEPGRQVEVYVLHRVVPHFDNETIDATLEVSPHPYPKFLTEPGVSYRVEKKFVTGNGAYLQQGLPPYPGGQDLRYARPSREPTIGPAEPDYMESARIRAQWSVYQVTVELWKRQRQDPLPALQTQVTDAASNASTVKAPPADVVARVRKQMGDLEKKIVELEDIAQGQIDTFRGISIEPAFRRDQEAFKASLPALRLALERVGSIGGTQGLTREEAGFQRILYALSKQLSLRTAAYQQQLELAREAERKREQEEEKRMRAIRRKGWDYLASVVGAACADPARASQLNADGHITGIELSHIDFTVFFIDDTVTRNDLVGIVRGESVPKLDACQEAVLRSMLDARRTVSIAQMIALARDWRVRNPTPLERFNRAGERLGLSIAGAFEAMGKALNDLVNEIVSSSRNTGYTWGGDSGSSSREPREPRESSGIDRGGRQAPTIDLHRPDFGRGSTLGR